MPAPYDDHRLAFILDAMGPELTKKEFDWLPDSRKNSYVFDECMPDPDSEDSADG